MSAFDPRWNPILGAQGFQTCDLLIGNGLLVDYLPAALPAGVVGARIQAAGGSLKYYMNVEVVLGVGLQLPDQGFLDLTNIDQVKSFFVITSGITLLVQFFGGSAGSRR